MARPQKLNFYDIAETISIIINEDAPEEKEKILLTISSMQNHLIQKKHIKSSKPTIRNYGMNKDSIFLREFSEVFSYQTTGSKEYQGMIIYTEEFKEQEKRFLDYAKNLDEKLQEQKREN